MFWFGEEIKIKFEIENTDLEKYTHTKEYESFIKYVKNYMVDMYDNGDYTKAEAAKDILTGLYVLKNQKKSWQ